MGREIRIQKGRFIETDTERDIEREKGQNFEIKTDRERQKTDKQTELEIHIKRQAERKRMTVRKTGKVRERKKENSK